MLNDMSDLLTNFEKKNENKIANYDKNEYLLIQQEIDCPRCNGIMTLHFEFDLPGYFCEGCEFALHLANY
jgi:hypothetical protein